MKTLIIMRHGKAEGYNAEGDHERVLTDRGVRDATAAGLWLKGQGLIPDLVVSSDAARAQQTARLASAASGFGGEVVLDSAIYEASVSALLGVVHGLPNNARHVMIVGHNPGFEMLATTLATEKVDIGPMPTSAIAAFQFETENWTAIGTSPLKLIASFVPRKI